jgi:hypothetical protein
VTSTSHGEFNDRSRQAPFPPDRDRDGGRGLVKTCDAGCNSFSERDRLAAGDSVRVNTSSDDVPGWWLVSDAGGRTLGCLSLRDAHTVDGLMVNVSEGTPCPT